MLNKRWKMAYRLHCADRVGKPPEGAAIKSCGAERSGKDVVQTISGMCKEAE